MKYQKLTLEETRDNLIKWREQGNEEALILLINCNLGLVYYFVYRYLNQELSFDDLCSAGKEGLFKAINKFDYINHPVEKFSSYIAIAIDNQIKMELRSYNKHNHVLSFDQIIGKNDDDELKLEEIIGTDSKSLIVDVVNELRIDTIKEILQCLSPKERQIILLRYGFGKDKKRTLEEVATILGCSRQLVSKHEQKALTKMRRPGNIKKLKDFMED